MERPSISCTEALHQAGDTVHTYLHRAARMLDDRFGEGYAAANPALVAECIRSQALDYNTTAMTAAIYRVCDSLDEAAGFLTASLDEMTEKLAS